VHRIPTLGLRFFNLRVPRQAGPRLCLYWRRRFRARSSHPGSKHQRSGVQHLHREGDNGAGSCPNHGQFISDQPRDRLSTSALR
jgi:hypothetical protein